MGQEKECTMRVGSRSYVGTAYLETDYLLFRGAERVKIALTSVKQASADDGWLRIEHDGGAATFELGAAAAKWADKILRPPTLLDKLGVKSGLQIALEGELEPHFVSELGPTVKRGADLLFFGAKSGAELTKMGKLKTRLAPGGAIWVVYPKGKTEIREVEVIAAGRAAGLKDTKVARFSETHTALRFSLPREK